MSKNRSINFVITFFILVTLAVTPYSAGATHSWGNYHWARSSNPFTLQLGDNVSSAWDTYLGTTSSDWSQSSVLDTVIVPGHVTSKALKRCAATSGMVEVCNTKYGNNGWLGVASIWASGEHITQATVKLNDTYFTTSTYNKPAWRNLVMCQEVGHTFGLDHQDENFNNANLNTCMDYTNDPASNQHPNTHDYEQLETIYAHLDSSSTVSSMPAGFANADVHAIENWGVKVSDNGHSALFVRDFGNGFKIFTFVIWATE